MKPPNGETMASFIKDGIDTIAALAVKAAETKIFEVPQEPKHIYWVQDHQGHLARQIAEPAVRDHSFHSIASLASMSKDCHSVWYSRHGVVLVFDDKFRDVGTVKFALSPQMERLQSLANVTSAMNQKAIVSFLRVDMARCFPQHQGLVACLRNIKWTNKDEGASAVGQGKASLGRTIEQKVVGIDEIPEDVTFDVPVFHGYPWRAEVPCVLDCDAETRHFTVRPIFGSIESALRAAELCIQQDLLAALGAGSKIPVYYGTP